MTHQRLASLGCYDRTPFSSVTSLTFQQLVSLAFYDDRKSLTSCYVQSLLENPLAPLETCRFNVQTKWVHILGSCNGLLCLADRSCLFRLMNPFTRLASKRSPPLDVRSPPVDLDVRDDVITQYGFGYDQVNNKYKVLITYGFPRVTKLYTFGTKSWTTIQNFPCDHQVPWRWWDKQGKFVSGSLNWWVPERNGIISFDLEKETYGEVLLPLHMGGDHPFNHVLEVLSNRLCLCYFNDIHCVVWLIKKYGNQQSWKKLMLIPHSKLNMAMPMPIHASCCLRPLCISENGIVFMRTIDLQLVSYNTKNGSSDDPEINMGRYRRDDMHIYHESLISPP
ncbi:F-box/kelch-repeat protein At3g06240-like [Lotus japonicus]|uniref:F-box/kelch-repeat protein At3g06240-like n=1 Tax=Lotus japonicus TaxID=34305 RepID=UPI0025882007|nr:F-box/kelch-repeat protein At3g06240-like [Lotus japonicus]